MVQNDVCPKFRVVPLNQQVQQIWFSTQECDPSPEAMSRTNEELFLQSSGAFSLRLDDLTYGLVEIRLSAVFNPLEIDMSFDEAIEMVKNALRKTASNHPSYDPTMCNDH